MSETRSSIKNCRVAQCPLCKIWGIASSGPMIRRNCRTGKAKLSRMPWHSCATDMRSLTKSGNAAPQPGAFLYKTQSVEIEQYLKKHGALETDILYNGRGPSPRLVPRAHFRHCHEREGRRRSRRTEVWSYLAIVIRVRHNPAVPMRDVPIWHARWHSQVLSWREAVCLSLGKTITMN